MTRFTRRSWMKTNAAAAAACAAYVPERAYATQQGKIILSHVLSLNQPDRLKLCLQMGVTHLVSTPALAGIGADQYEAAMQNHHWILERLNYQTPVQTRLSFSSLALGAAA